MGIGQSDLLKRKDNGNTPKTKKPVFFYSSSQEITGGSVNWDVKSLGV